MFNQIRSQPKKYRAQAGVYLVPIQRAPSSDLVPKPHQVNRSRSAAIKSRRRGRTRKPETPQVIGGGGDKWIEPLTWDEDAGGAPRNSLCEICQRAISNMIKDWLPCTYCNVVAHIGCLEQQGARSRDKTWICSYCIDSIQDSKSSHQERQSRKVKQQRMVLAQIFIAKCWRSYQERKRYLKLRRFLGLLTDVYRIGKFMKYSRKFRVGKLRPIRLRLRRCSGFPVVCAARPEKHIILLITVVDLFTSTQDRFGDDSFKTSWRAESKLVTIPGNSSEAEINDVHVLAGVSGHAKIYITVLQKITASVSLFLGQAELHMIHQNIWRTGVRTKLPLEVPILGLAEVSHMPIDCTTVPSGSVEIELEPTSFNMDTEVGYMQGTSVDDLSRLLKQMPKSAAMYIPSRSATGGKHHIASKETGSSGGSKGGGGSIQSGALPIRLLWVHITGGTIFVYSHIGGHIKVVLNLKHFRLKLQNQGGRRTRMVLKPDEGFLPTIEFITTKSDQNLAWRLAFTSSYRKAKLLPPEPFNMNAVWQDVFKLGYIDTQEVSRGSMQTGRRRGGGGLGVSTGNRSRGVVTSVGAAAGSAVAVGSVVTVGSAGGSVSVTDNSVGGGGGESAFDKKSNRNKKEQRKKNMHKQYAQTTIKRQHHQLSLAVIAAGAGDDNYDDDDDNYDQQSVNSAAASSASISRGSSLSLPPIVAANKKR